MRRFPFSAFLPLLLVLAAVASLGGCAEDLLGGHSTAISGKVVDPASVGIPGVGVGISYTAGPVPSSGVLPVAAGEVTLRPPYPNPTTGAVTGSEVRIPIQVASETTLDVSILTLEGGVYSYQRRLFTGMVTQDTTFLWDGQGLSGYLPNGLHRVRVTVPAVPPAGTDPTVLEADVLVNRSASLMEAIYGYNAQSDPGGEYVLQDVAVGARFDATNNSGGALGTYRVSESLYLLFRSPDHVPKEVLVTIAPGDLITITTTLDPLFPAAGPALAGSP